MKHRARRIVWQSPKDHLWYWGLVGGNGETVCFGEGHARRANAVRAARRAVALMAGSVLEIHETKRGRAAGSSLGP